ncbi:MAG: LlaJI family restriction endonuclease [Eubacteriales bacterium]
MENKSLWDRCHINSNFEEDKFVGLKMDNDNITVSFPLGYHCAKAEDKVIRREILSLFSILQKFNSKKDSEKSNYSDDNVYLDFPILSYQFLIMDFLKNGYYTEKEKVYKNATRGKISWKRTIQKNKPYISGTDMIYLDFIIKKNNINSDTILTRIHEYCVYESFLKLGWLYTSVLPRKPRIKLNKRGFISVLKDALNQTFDNDKKQRFIAMINIINNVSEGSTNIKSFSYGTSKFEYTWEKMIDYVFGETNKEIYFPKAQWKLVYEDKTYPSSSLEPDTIIKLDNRIYILDAKYYKFGVTGNYGHLPASSSIQKQITYGEFLDNEKSIKQTKRKQPYDCIYNAFIIPFNKSKRNDENFKFIGVATADWKDDSKTYEYVLAILLDTKHIMASCYRQNFREIEELTTLIENSYEFQKKEKII